MDATARKTTWHEPVEEWVTVRCTLHTIHLQADDQFRSEFPRLINRHAKLTYARCSYAKLAPVQMCLGSDIPSSSVYAAKWRGLAFLIKNLYYEDIAVNITNTLDLEAQEKFWTFKKANMISFENTIIEAAKVSIPKAYALENTDLNKTPGPDGIHGRMISNLGKFGKERLLNIFNNSWKTGKLP
ncbi:hypothetical protein LAZ67_2004635 [Cordylochernes scorpioides]|uniref:Uncharacterized protein n=1 Tax=Cordylochernes scorpioides TaxID=51811 RepID=A0ABY6K3W1_9ARAC|nr:hypothetical protein LAZ67_2004635 [Cordylochernes scorpioides]